MERIEEKDLAHGARQSSIQAAQELLRQFVPVGRSLSTELIQERREENNAVATGFNDELIEELLSD
jgi:hypothetical protein